MTSNATDAAYDAAIAYATNLGAEHGRNAAGWYVQDTIGGRSGGSFEDDKRAAARILRGIEDGDPAILDTLPSADLSGQWADTLTGPQLTHDALSEGGLSSEDDAYDSAFDAAFTDVCDAYESAFSDAAESAIAAAARAILA